MRLFIFKENIYKLKMEKRLRFEVKAFSLVTLKELYY